MLSIPLLLSQAKPVESALKVDSVLDFVVKGGPVMMAIIACSLLALAVIVERFVSLRRRTVTPPDFLQGLQALSTDSTRAMDFCLANGSPIANILAAGLKRRGQGVEATEKALEEAGHREVIRLRQRMRVLGALPQVSTMLGLLGTIFGMIKTFQAVAASGQTLGKTEVLAKGIFEAWTNTAAGLLVAIPVLIFYHMLLGKIDQRMVDLDRAATDFMDGQRFPASQIGHRPPAQTPADMPVLEAAAA